MSGCACKIATASLALASLLAMGGVAAAADFYEGKTVTVQVPSGSGGTYHVYCQIVAGQIGKHIAGSPKVIIQNLPGAGGAKSASYMMNVAPKNGTYIAMHLLFSSTGQSPLPPHQPVRQDGLSAICGHQDRLHRYRQRTPTR